MSQTQTTKTLVRGDKVFSTVHGRWVRVSRVDGCWVAVMDCETHKELPDEVHVSQVK